MGWPPGTVTHLLLRLAVSLAGTISKDAELEKLPGLDYVSTDAPGITRRTNGKGFVYFGPDSRRIRDQATLKRIHSLVIPPAWEAVWICPKASGHIQAVGRDARGRKQYRYHPEYRAFRDQTKFGRMAAFGRVLPKIRERVSKDLSLPGLPKPKVVAAIVRLLDETCMRVGNEEYARSNHSFGLTTLRDRHADIKGDCIRLHFRGKSHQDHDIMLRDRKLSRIVKQCQDLAGQDLFQYQENGGEPVKVGSSDVNDYLREITGDEFSAKDFRTWHGTIHMAQQLAALGPASSQTEAKRNIVAAVKETAKRLGNRPAACRKYYVHPAVFESYLDESIFELMRRAAATSARAGELEPVERAVLRLSKSV